MHAVRGCRDPKAAPHRVQRRIMAPMTPSESGWEALDAGAWLRARDDLLSLADDTRDPLALEGAAQAAWWLDDADTCLSAREGAYHRFRELGDDRGAARAATALAYDSVLFGAGHAVGLGWLSRANSLLAPLDESVEHGWCAVRTAELALSAQHDPVGALASAERASAIATRLDEAELGVVSLALEGLALTQVGQIDAGMPRLDAAVAAATTGEVADVMWMGKVCCWLIAACDETRDVTRAAEWCRRVEVVCKERDLVPLFNVCRIQYASVQVAQGTWADAENELVSTLGRLSGSRRTSRLEAVVQLGELRRRQGRFGEADALFLQAEFHPTAIAGRALIKLSAGDAAGAWVAMSALLRILPSDNRLIRAHYLLPAVQAAHAAGDEAAAVAAAEELRQTARTMGTDALLGLAAVADATLAEGPDRLALLREGVHRFAVAGLRYDEADTRLELARALLDAGDVTAGREQLATVSPMLADLSAAAGAATAADLETMAGTRPPGPLTAREVEVLRLVSRGLSNRDIATELVVSEHTVHRHVSNILTKLDQPSRAAAVAYAIGAGLLPA